MRISAHILTLPVLVLLLFACTDGMRSSQSLPPLETRADSIAMRALESLGGPRAWASLPILRFDFGNERDGTRSVSRRHLWNRKSGAYRLEWNRGADSSYTALFNVNSRDGQVYLNGEPLDADQNREQLAGAYRGFVNDTYWMLMPVKMLDPGVIRTHVPDSSDGQHEVVMLSFEEVGLTPGDRYWVYVDRESGRVDRWAYILQSMPPDGPASVFEWTGYEEHPSPRGAVHIATRKQVPAGNYAVLTDNVSTPERVPAELFSDPAPGLL
jgi:hypothetical protein